MNRKFRRRVLMIGCGALGGALIHRLCPYADVVAVDPVLRIRSRKKIVLRVADLNERSFDAVIVTTKCYDLQQALMPLKDHISFKRILFLQNGIINLTQIRRAFSQVAFVRGVTTAAVGVVRERFVFYYQGEFFLAPEDEQENEAVGWFKVLLTDAGFKTSSVSKSSRIVWSKLIFSAAMNPLPIITGEGYDILRKDLKTWALVRQAVDEGRATARALGVRLAFDPLRLIRRVRDGDLAGLSHQGSMTQDIVAGHKTELDFIVGALIRQARKVGVKTPALDLILVKAKKAGA